MNQWTFASVKQTLESHIEETRVVPADVLTGFHSPSLGSFFELPRSMSKLETLEKKKSSWINSWVLVLISALIARRRTLWAVPEWNKFPSLIKHVQQTCGEGHRFPAGYVSVSICTYCPQTKSRTCYKYFQLSPTAETGRAHKRFSAFVSRGFGWKNLGTLLAMMWATTGSSTRRVFNARVWWIWAWVPCHRVSQGPQSGRTSRVGQCEELLNMVNYFILFPVFLVNWNNFCQVVWTTPLSKGGLFGLRGWEPFEYWFSLLSPMLFQNRAIFLFPRLPRKQGRRPSPCFLSTIQLAPPNLQTQLWTYRTSKVF